MTTKEGLNELHKLMMEEEELQLEINGVTESVDLEIKELLKQLEDANSRKNALALEQKEKLKNLSLVIVDLIESIPTAWDSPVKTIKIDNMAYTVRTTESVVIPDENELKGYCRSFKNQPFTTKIKWDKKALRKMVEIDMIPKDMIEIQQKNTLVRKKLD